jgi:predicted nucleotide-binding protein
VADKSSPRLLVTRTEADTKIRERIHKAAEVIVPADMATTKANLEKWSKYNIQMLRSIFDSPDISDEYGNWWASTSGYTNPWNILQKHLEGKVTRLESILERLEFFQETLISDRTEQSSIQGNTNEVFIVHGHDNEALHDVSKFVERLGLTPVVLHEKANAGRTIIEKFEAHSNVSYAIVLLTADDVGASKDKKDALKSRARQNVIFELGYFFAKIGRSRVCGLLRGIIETPSDYDGIVYIPMDEGGGWKLFLAKELKQAGLDIDLNRVL